MAGSVPFSGGIERIPISAELVHLSEMPATWSVEAINAESDGEVYLAIFQGPQARNLAREYALAKFRELK